MKVQCSAQEIIIGVIPLLSGNGANYIATNVAYEYAKLFRKQQEKIALINLRPNNILAGNLILDKDELTTHLKFNIDLFVINSKEEFDKIKSEYKILICVLDFEQLELFNSFTKKKTNILVLKKNFNNLEKLTKNIETISKNIKYTVFNCPEKTNDVNFRILKENYITNIANIPYDELTIDNCNIKKARKVEKIKYLNAFKKIVLTKVKIDKI